MLGTSMSATVKSVGKDKKTKLACMCEDNGNSLFCKILTDNTVYADNVSSPYVTASTGVDFTAKSTHTNGQGLYTNNKLEDGKNTYFRGGSYCAYTSYASEDTSGTYCTAAGGTWSNYKCNLDTNRAACQSGGFTYYDLKNNVTFAGHNWRIIRIDENNNIRMILADDSVTKTAFNSSYNDNAHVGYMYGTVPSTTYENAHTNTNNSTIMTYSNNTYAILSSYSSYLSDAGYCNDRTLNSGVGYGTNTTYYGPYARNYVDSTASPRLACPNPTRDLFTTSTNSIGNKALTYPVGLITIDEARYAGMVSSGGTSTKYNFTNYLKFNKSYWTMSPVYVSTTSAYEYLVYSYGYFYHTGAVYANYSLRSSVSLKSNTTVSSGTGTYDDPYVIQ